MKILKEPQIISGFIYEEPVDDIPAITHCGEALCCRGHHLKPHRHSGFEFLYISRGSVSWKMKEALFSQSMGDLFITFPEQLHGTGTKANPENHHLWVGLELEKLGEKGRCLARLLKTSNRHLLPNCSEMEFVLRGLVSQVMTLQPKRKEVILGYLDAFMALVEQKISLLSRKSKTKRVLPYSYAIQKALHYVEQNLDRRLPLQDIAAAATASNIPHFCTDFHKEVGISPAAYHLQLRLDAARVALKESDFNVTMAALQFGFSSSQHFSTQFRRAYGITPRQWQNRAAHAAKRL
jgi:AraC-like DNA-binding protein